MGMVIRFPDVWRNARLVGTGKGQDEPASVIILPVVRIERQTAKSTGDAKTRAASGRTRRRRRPSSQP
jgi:hypothetical protein